MSFPWPLRLLFASRPDALSRCLAVITRAIETGLIQRAGLTRASRARTGVVTLIQRFGRALNLNVHLHMIILDGVYTLKSNRPGFHQVNAPDQQHLEKLLNRVIARVMRCLVKDGLLIQDQEQPWLDLQDTDTLDSFNAAFTRYRVVRRLTRSLTQSAYPQTYHRPSNCRAIALNHATSLAEIARSSS